VFNLLPQRETFMPAPTELEALDLAALLCSRVCHDLINPVAAIVNGLMVLEEEKDEEMRSLATTLVKNSSHAASARLQFCRIAFGAAGSAGAQIDTGDAEKVARGFLEDEKTSIAWTLQRAYLPKNRVKLLLNMMVAAGQTIPRGGSMIVEPIGEGEAVGFRVAVKGAIVRMSEQLPKMLAGGEGDTIEAQTIQPYYTGLLARQCKLDLAIVKEDDGVVLTATPSTTGND
jgi:histidine phosphotransferase ChpT